MVDSRVIDPFDPNRSWSVEALRGPEGLRRWTNDDVVPRPGDVFQERLYCIRWVKMTGRRRKRRRYAAPDEADLAREAKVLELLRERFADWQREGFIPSKAIPEGGDKTERAYSRARLDPLASPVHAAAVVDAWVDCGESRDSWQSKQHQGRLLAWALDEWRIGIRGSARGCQMQRNERGNRYLLQPSAEHIFSTFHEPPFLKLGHCWPVFS